VFFNCKGTVQRPNAPLLAVFSNPNIRCDPLSITPKPLNRLARAAFSKIELVVISLEDRTKYWLPNYIELPQDHALS